MSQGRREGGSQSGTRGLIGLRPRGSETKTLMMYIAQLYKGIQFSRGKLPVSENNFFWKLIFFALSSMTRLFTIIISSLNNNYFIRF